MTDADRLLIAAYRAIGIMYGLGSDDQAEPDEAQEALRQTCAALRVGADKLNEAVEVYVKARVME